MFLMLLLIVKIRASGAQYMKAYVPPKAYVAIPRGAPLGMRMSLLIDTTPKVSECSTRRHVPLAVLRNILVPGLYMRRSARR